MSIGYEAIQRASGTGVSSIASPAITPVGDNRLLIAFGGNSAGSGAPAAYSDMTFGAAQMVPKWNSVQQTILRTVAEYLVNPSRTGAAVTYVLAGADALCFVAAIALSGVNQNVPMDSESAGSVAAGTAAVAVTLPSEVGDLVVDFFFGGGTSIAINNGNTLRAKIENVLGASAGVSTKDGAGSVTTGWIRTGTALPAGVVAVNVNASRGVSGTNIWQAYHSARMAKILKKRRENAEDK
jgi:hypothetical protein